MTTRKLNYIGAKAKLARWICEIINLNCARDGDEGPVRVADLFCGSGDMTIALRANGYATVSIDAEVYATVITRAHASGACTARMRALIAECNSAQLAGEARVIGAVEDAYSADSTETQEGGRMFFTRENARRIDKARAFIRDRRDLTENERAFLIASLIISADKVANIASVYGAYLKSFKSSARTPFVLEPIHTRNAPLPMASRVRRACLPFADAECMRRALNGVSAVYMDPPYNGRQYSKNYFVLNAIADVAAERFAIVEGSKTGILADCYTSPFCQAREVRASFARLLAQIAGCQQVRDVFISYSSESLVPIDELCAIATATMGEVRECAVECTLFQKIHRRFASSRGQMSSDAMPHNTTVEYVVHLHLAPTETAQR